MIKNKRILITGCAGSIGSELARQLYQHNNVIGVDFNETGIWDLKEELGIDVVVGDIKDENVLAQAFKFRPQIVFHAASLKHVVVIEITPQDAVDPNIPPTLNLIDLCKRNYAKFIFISTDKAVNPSCVMGASKLFGEVVTRNAGFIAVRFGNVMNSRGSVLPIWQRQLRQGRPLTVTDPRMERFMMTIEEAVALVIVAAEKGEKGDLIVLDMGKQVKIIEIAKEILSKARGNQGLKVIGIRQGEKLSEQLLTEQEEKNTIKKNSFYVIKRN